MGIQKLSRSNKDAYTQGMSTSESWCNIEQPPAGAELQSKHSAKSPKASARQRVTTWLEKYHTDEPQHQQLARPASASSSSSLSSLADRDCDVSGHIVNRSLSEASLGDFLKAHTPFRPKFLDTKGKNPDISDQRGSPPVLISLASKSGNRDGILKSRRVGWVAQRLGVDNGGEQEEQQLQQLPPLSPIITSSDNKGNNNAGDRRNKESTGSDNGINNEAQIQQSLTLPSPLTDGDAVFLSYAFQHFVAFQPLDFATAVPVDKDIAIEDNEDRGESDDAGYSPEPNSSGQPGAAPPPAAANPNTRGVWGLIAGFFNDIGFI